MGFDSLPGHRVNYPIANFHAPAPPPVSQTAAMAAQLAKEVTDLGDRLSPEARKTKEIQFAILGSKLRLDNAQAELAERNNNILRQQQDAMRKSNAAAQGTIDKAFGPSNKDKTSAVLNPPRWDLGDTDPFTYHRKDDLSLDRPGVFSLQLAGEVQPALPTDELPADIPTEEVDPTD